MCIVCYCLLMFICPVGLEIQLGNNKSKQHFDCGCGYFNQTTPPSFVEWLPLTQHEVTYQHIRLHRLTEEDSLSLFMSTMASIPATLAVIFINTGNDYRLPGKSQPNEQGPPIPVLVVTREIGEKLLGLVRDNPRAVEARMVTHSGPLFSLSLRPPAAIPGRLIHTCMYMCTCIILFTGIYIYAYACMYKYCIITCYWE